MDMAAEAGRPAFVYVEIVGAIIGFGLLAYLINIVRQLGGAVGNALKRLTFGVAAFTAAFAISAVVDWFSLASMQNSMIGHMSLMTVAMVVTIFSAITFAGLLK